MQRKDPFITGEYYHLFNRGIDKRIIFKSPSDYRRFTMLLYVSNSSSQSFRLDNLLHNQNKKFHDIFSLDRKERLISIGSWCLMPNHFHILVRQNIDGGITKFMQKLGTGYSMYFNIKYERQGALFGGPFKSKLIHEDDTYLKHLFGYININPLDIKFPDWENSTKKYAGEMANFLADYSFSSYKDLTEGPRIESPILSIEEFPEYFEDANSFKDFIDNYFVEYDKS